MFFKDYDSVNVNYEFLSEQETAELKYKRDVLSYAGKLLQLARARTLVVALDNLDQPFVLMSPARLFDPLNIITSLDL